MKERVKEKLKELLSHDLEFRYMLLARMKMDCDYFLGNGERYEKVFMGK